MSIVQGKQPHFSELWEVRVGVGMKRVKGGNGGKKLIHSLGIDGYEQISVRFMW